MRSHGPAPLTLALALALGGCAAGNGVQKEPGSAERLARINTQLGIEYMRQGDNEVAMNRLEKALQADPRYAGAHEAMALLFVRLREYTPAESAFRRALQLAPKDSSIMNNYGLFLCQRGRREEAEALFRRAVENPLYETPQVVYTNAGTCARDAGELEQAERYYRLALQRAPTFAPALIGMAEVALERERHMSARAYLQRYEAVAPLTPPALWLGVRIERVLGDADAEASYALALTNRFPDSLEAGLLLESERP